MIMMRIKRKKLEMKTKNIKNKKQKTTKVKMNQKDQTHQLAVMTVELFLQGAKKEILVDHVFNYPPEFVEKHKWKKYPGHTFDILTRDEVIEIDDLDRHLHKEIMINDGVATDYAETYLEPAGYKFYRLLKENIVDRKGWILPDAGEYLKKSLF
jgi:hypothetical protein